ncbi:MAG: hypothetical protein IKY09_02705 [Methanocorpusculum sp.]|nr:hypothetical protein [Methanocorpusculum sp.]MBR5450584.1 hypothetical protein [Methanocorpusculum sp.]
MNAIFKRILEKKEEVKLTWDEIAKRAHIRLAPWMTGLSTCRPTDTELKKIAPVLNTTYKYLKYGTD